MGALECQPGQVAPGSTPLILQHSPSHSGPPAWVSAFPPAIHPPHPAGALLATRCHLGIPSSKQPLPRTAPGPVSCRGSGLSQLEAVSLGTLCHRGCILHSSADRESLRDSLRCVLIYQMLVKSQLYVHCARCWQKMTCETELCPHGVHSRGGLQGREQLTNITRTSTFAL